VTGGRRPRVIIIDDDESVRQLLGRFLSKRGYEVHSFSDPSFCHVYRKHEGGCENHHACADVLITDYKMPHMSGIELLKQQCANSCKQHCSNKAVISGMLTGDEKALISSLGATVFHKPFTLKEIEAWLAEREKYFDLSAPLEPVDPA